MRMLTSLVRSRGLPTEEAGWGNGMEPLEPRLLLNGSTDLEFLAHLTAGDGAEGDWFGQAVSISNHTAMVGAPNDDDAGKDSGSVYVFEQIGGTWQEAGKLAPSDHEAGDSFGASVGVYGDLAIIGATGDDDGGFSSGSAYIFQNTGGTWQQVAKLTASDGETGAEFGYSVSISGDTAVVGAYNVIGHTGAAYIFQKFNGTWQELAQLSAIGVEADEGVGRSVSISGGTVLVGAELDDPRGLDSGSVIVYREVISGLWTQVALLAPAGGQAGDHFGSSVALNGIAMAIGARSANGGTGAAYVFEKGVQGWEEAAMLTASDGQAGDAFGWSVGIDGATAVVGAHDDTLGSTAFGSAYVFRNTGAGWAETAKLVATGSTAGDAFGQAVAVSGQNAIVGAYRHDDKGDDSGSAYVYDVAPAESDLDVSQLHIDAGAYAPGTALLGQVRVQNLGSTNVTETFQYEAHLSVDEVWGNGDDIVFYQAAWDQGVDAGADLVHDIAGIIPTDAAPGSYYVALQIDSTNALPDEASKSNNLVWTNSADVIVKGGYTIGEEHAGSLTFQDADGTTVTVALKGGGTASIFLAGDITQDIQTGKKITVEGTDLVIEQILLTDTSATSALSFATKGGTVPGTPIGNIIAEGDVGKILGKTADLAGNVMVPGLVKTLQLGNVDAGHVIDIAGDATVGAKDKIVITLGRVADTALSTHALPIGALTATEWLDTDAAADAIAGSWLGKLTMKGRKANAKKGIAALAGDFQADLDLDGADKKGNSLGSATIAGGVGDAVWDVANSAGKVTVKGTVDGWQANLKGGLKSLTAGDIDSANVSVSDALGTVKAQRWGSGTLDADSIKAINITGLKGNVKKGIDAVEGTFGADVSVRGENVTKGSALGSAKIAADLTSGSWAIDGDMGKLTVGRWVLAATVMASGDMLGLTLGGTNGGEFLAGIDLDTQIFDEAGQIRSIAVKGWKVAKGETLGVVGIDSGFWAARMGGVSVLNAQDTDAYELHVLGAAENWQIKSVNYRDTDTGEKWTWKPGKPWPGAAGTEPQSLT